MTLPGVHTFYQGIPEDTVGWSLKVEKPAASEGAGQKSLKASEGSADHPTYWVTHF